MPAPARERPGLLPPGRRGPAIIAHGGGNTRANVRESLAVEADFLEVDLWVHHGRFEARHERRLPLWLPLLYEKWYMRLAPRRPFGLAELLTVAHERTGVFLDLKDGGGLAAQLVADALGGETPPCPLAASSQHWGILRALGAAVPGVALFYSIDVQAKMDLFLSVSARDEHPRGVSCLHTLLDQDVIDRVHALGLQVVAWTVDDPRRAEELARMGVDGITTHRVRTMRELLGAP